MAGKATILTLPDPQATWNLGRQWGGCLPAGTAILLEGDLGAGKTTLVQGLGAGLGIREAIESPTFTLINEYGGGRLPLYHLDLYRLEPAEIEALDLEIYWEGKEVPPGITAIEWAQRLPYRPGAYLKVRLADAGAQGRQAAIQWVGGAVISHLLSPIPDGGQSMPS